MCVGYWKGNERKVISEREGESERSREGDKSDRERERKWGGREMNCRR